MDGHCCRKVLVTANTVGNVEKEVAEKMPGGNLESAKNLRNIKFLPKSQLGSADNFYLNISSQGASPKKTSTTAVTTTLATAIGKSPFQPRFMS